MPDIRVIIKNDILGIDHVVYKNLIGTSHKPLVKFAFRTGSTARGDFAITPEGYLSSDIEYLIICSSKQQKCINVDDIRENIFKLLNRNKLIDPNLVEISFSKPSGAWLRRRSYFFYEAIHEGVWLIGEEKKHILKPSSLSKHFVNFTLLTRLHDLSSAYELLRLDKLSSLFYISAIYKVAKTARHLCTMAYYRDADVYRHPSERKEYIYARYPEYRNVLEHPLQWSKRIYQGDKAAFHRLSALYVFDLLLEFIELYINNEENKDRWPIGRASVYERVRDSIFKSDYKLKGIIDPSYCYRKLAIDYLSVLKARDIAMLPALKQKFSSIVGDY